MSIKSKPIIFLNSHPIQYFAPLYQQITDATDLDLEVVYCSDDGIVGRKDAEFGVNLKWDIPLLEGYRYLFLKNYSFYPSKNNRMWGMINWGIIPYLYKKPPSLIIVHGWLYITHLLTIIFGKIFGHTICLRAETPLNQELLKPKTITFFKHRVLQVLFLFIDHFLYIGFQNKLFYQKMGIAERKLHFAPYCVDNERFHTIHTQTNKTEARKKLGLPLAPKIILFSGKYIEKKRPFDLLQAIMLLGDIDFLLVMVGDGELRPRMLTFIEEHQLEKKVVLTRFVNQTEIPFYYAAADVFIMCSGLGETWGLSVNEAMNFELPIVISDACGCSYDLVEHQKNGFIFPMGNIHLLQEGLEKCLHLKDNAMGNYSLQKIKQYSFQQVIQTLMRLSNE